LVRTLKSKDFEARPGPEANYNLGTSRGIFEKSSKLLTEGG